jgi:hypothetical protein
VREANAANQFAGMSGREIDKALSNARRDVQATRSELITALRGNDAGKVKALLDSTRAKEAAYKEMRAKAKPSIAKAKTAGSEANKARQAASRAKLEAKYDKLDKQIQAHHGKAPFQGEIKGGNVQMNVVGSWRQSSRGQAWNAKDDKLMREFSDIKRRLGR